MIEIREAKLEDIPAIAQAHVKADWDTYAPLFGAEAYMLTIAESEDRWRRALEGGGLLLVASDRGVIVGLGHACADRIDALYLLSAYHCRGIGKAIFSRLLQFLHGRGILEAKLDVVAINDAAIGFYTAQGAHPVGRRVNTDPRGDTEDLILAVPTARARTIGQNLQHEQAQGLPRHLNDIADLIGSVDDDLPADLSARKKHYLSLWGYGRKRRRPIAIWHGEPERASTDHDSVHDQP